MLSSQFNVVKTIGNETWIFNTFSHAFIKMSTEDWLETINYCKSTEKDNTIIKKEYKDLASLGIIVEKPDEQLKIFKYGYYAQMFRKTSTFLYIAPTMQCNLNCFYCFEGDNKKGKRMSQETIEDLIDFIVSSKIDDLYIVWFGGEPALAFDQIFSICENLSEKSIRFHSSMITNGTLLTLGKIKQLYKLNLDFIQISIDGVGLMHDKRRCFKSGAPSFDLIIKNIGLILTETDIPITIQVTIDKNNKSAFADVSKYMQSHFPLEYSTGRLSIGKNYVQNRTGFDKSGSCFSGKDILEELIRQKDSNGIIDFDNYLSLPNKTSPCMFRCRGTFAIDPHGDIHKCIEHIGNESNRVGSVKCKSISIGKISNCAIGNDPFSDSECMNCNILPICGGGCPIDRIKLKKGEIKSCCSPYKETLADSLPLIYEHSKKLSE